MTTTDRPAVLPLDTVKREYTLAALAWYGWKVKPTAEALGVNPSSLNNWLREWRAKGLLPPVEPPAVPTVGAK